MELVSVCLNRIRMCPLWGKNTKEVDRGSCYTQGNTQRSLAADRRAHPQLWALMLWPQSRRSPDTDLWSLLLSWAEWCVQQPTLPPRGNNPVMSACSGGVRMNRVSNSVSCSVHQETEVEPFWWQGTFLVLALVLCSPIHRLQGKWQFLPWGHKDGVPGYLRPEHKFPDTNDTV